MKTKAKILILTAYWDSFSGYQEIILAESLLKSGYDVTVISSDKKFSLFRDIDVVESKSDIKVIRHRSAEIMKSFIFLKGLGNLRITLIEADYIFIQPASQMLFVQLLLRPILFRQLRKKIIFTFQDNTFQYNGLRPLAAFVKRLVWLITKGVLIKLATRNVPNIFNNTNDGVLLMKSWLNLDCKLFPLAINPSMYFFDNHLREQERLRFGLSEKDFVILIVGKLAVMKRTEDVLNWFIVNNTVNTKIYIVGSGEQYYEELIDSYCRVYDNNLEIRRFPFVSQQELNTFFNIGDHGIWHRQPAITIQQALATGLKVSVPMNNALNHLVNCEGVNWIEDCLNGFALSHSDLISKRSERSYHNTSILSMQNTLATILGL